MLKIIKKIVKKILDNDRGFTLLELMIVVTILGILASIAIPRFTNQVSTAKSMKTQADIAIIQNAVDLYFYDNGAYPNDTAALANDGYLRENPVKNDGHSHYLINPGNGKVTE